MRDQGSSPQPQCFFGSLLVANYGIVDPPGDRTRDDDDDDDNVCRLSPIVPSRLRCSKSG